MSRTGFERRRWKLTRLGDSQLPALLDRRHALSGVPAQELQNDEGQQHQGVVAGISLVFAGDVVNGIWFALIGWLIQNSASAYRHAPKTSELQTRTVGEVMTRTVDPVPPEIDLDEAVHYYLLREGQRALPVGTDSHLLGMLSMTDVQRFPRDQWPVIAVDQAMTPADHVETVPSTMPVMDALRLMSEHRRQELPVVDNGRLVGLLTQAGVMRYFQLRSALGLATLSKQREPAASPPASRSHQPPPRGAAGQAPRA